MGFEDRLTWLILGVALGFFLGYVTRLLRENTEALHDIKEELDEVDEIVKEQRRDRGQEGLMSRELGNKIALALVVLLTAWAAFQSQRALNGLNDTQDDLKATQAKVIAVTSCTSAILEQAISALNVRTESTREQTTANVELQRAQAAMLEVLLHEPPYPPEERTEAARAYFEALNAFIEASGKYKSTGDKNPYPTEAQLNTCIDNGMEKALKEAQEEDT